MPPELLKRRKTRRQFNRFVFGGDGGLNSVVNFRVKTEASSFQKTFSNKLTKKENVNIFQREGKEKE